MRFSMTPKRYNMILIIGLCLLIGVIMAAVYVGNSLLTQEAKKLTSAKVSNKAAEQQLVALAQAKKDIEKYKDLEKIAKSVVPQDKDQARTIREITKLAEESGIKLKAFTFQTSSLGQATPAAPKPAEGEASTAPTTPAAPPITQVKPVDGISGVYSLEITVNPQDKQRISYQQFLTFLEKLENNRRTAHVDKISITPNENGLTFSLTLKAYVKP